MRPIHPLRTEKICANCRYFHQHYAYIEGWYRAVNCGHCHNPRIKEREPFDNACSHFEEKTYEP